jgi:hypothetical protein
MKVRNGDMQSARIKSFENFGEQTEWYASFSQKAATEKPY